MFVINYFTFFSVFFAAICFLFNKLELLCSSKYLHMFHFSSIPECIQVKHLTVHGKVHNVSFGLLSMSISQTSPKVIPLQVTLKTACNNVSKNVLINGTNQKLKTIQTAATVCSPCCPLTKHTAVPAPELTLITPP